MVMYRKHQDPGFPGCILHGDQCYSFQLPLDLKRQLICVHNKAKQFLSAGGKKKEAKFMHALTHHLVAAEIDIFI